MNDPIYLENKEKCRISDDDFPPKTDNKRYKSNIKIRRYVSLQRYDT